MTKLEPWLERTLEYFTQIDTAVPTAAPPRSMALRERTKPVSTASEAPASPSSKAAKKKPKDKVVVKQEQNEELVGDHHPAEPAKKLPRVVLKLGPQPTKEAS